MKLRKNSQMISCLIAAAMLFLALAKLPYGYYQLLRWVVCGVSIYSAMLIYGARPNLWWLVWTLAGTVIIFNPLAPFRLQRETWKVANFAAGVLLVGVAFLDTKKRDREI